MLIVITPNGKDSRKLYNELCHTVTGKVGVTDIIKEIYVTLPSDATYDLDTVISICEKYGDTERDDA